MARKNKKKKKPDEGSDSHFSLGIAQETKNGIWGIISFGFAVLTTLAFFHKAGFAGDLLNKTTRTLFGWGIFLVPVSLLLIGVSFFKSVSRRIYKSVLFGICLFILTFLGVFYILGNGNVSARISQGGYLGLVLGYPLLTALGFTASLILLLILLVASVLITLDISVLALFRKPEEEEEAVPLRDKVVIKRGTEIVDQKAEEAEQKRGFKAQVSPIKTKGHKTGDEEEKEFVIKASRSGAWVLPPLEILHSDKDRPNAGDINVNVNIIKRTLANFGIDVEMGEVSIGPTVTQFTLRPAVGVKLSKITALNQDLSLALAAHPIRIEAPIPGKSLVGIEVPNKKSALVGLRNLFEGEDFQSSRFFLPIALGRDVAGFPVFGGIDKMPHLLIAGATGTGKSVMINTLLLSLLYKHSPNMLKLILVDPKRVELSLYDGIPHLITPVIHDAKKVINALRWAVREMEKRYESLSSMHSRDIFSYNVKRAEKKEDLMPFIIIIIDELADIMAAYGRDVEAAIVRLAQMSRAVGIHLVVSTQRPSVEVITGLIKANITSRIALQVASQVDSRTILDSAGAEKLLGNGDMLYQAGDTAKMRRVQGGFVSEKEVKDVVKFIKQQAESLEETLTEPAEKELEVDLEQAVSGGMGENDDVGDDLYEDAKEVVAQAGKASASLLQRRLRVGYARAARLLDLLEENGVIGPGEGAKPREVYIGRAASPKPSDDFVEDSGETAGVVSGETGDFENRRDDKIATEE